MSTQRREEILEQMLATLRTVTVPETPNTVVRNRGLLDNDMRPAFALLDGDEATLTPGDRRGRQRMQPVRVRMTPQVFVITKIQKPQNETIGQVLNGFRASIIRALADDVQLLTLIGANGDIAYDGCVTDLKTGMQMEGQMQLQFSLLTWMNPYSN